MAWQTPPTFTDTDVLSAAQLNIIRDDLQYLRGLSSTVNIPSANVVCDIRTAPTLWQIRHRAAYLNIYVDWVIDASWVDHFDLSITIGATELITGGAGPDPWVPGVASPAYFAFDVSSLTAGTWYEIAITPIAHDGLHVVPDTTGSTRFHVLRLFESDTSFA